jgi:hypothetical protein
MRRDNQPLARLVLLECSAAATLAALVHPAGVGGALHALRDGSWSWWAAGSTATLSAAVLWLAAAALTAWCWATTLTCVASRAVPVLRPLRALDALTAPAIRRAVDRAVAVSLMCSPLGFAFASPATAATARPPATTANDASPPAVVRVGPGGEILIAPRPGSRARARAVVPTTTTTAITAPPPTTTPTTTPAATAAPPPGPTPPPAPGTPAPATAHQPRRTDLYTVVPGDNFWTIAAARIAAATRRAPAAADIAPYWQRVVDANRSSICSGDPNLIFPGEIVMLPPLV